MTRCRVCSANNDPRSFHQKGWTTDKDELDEEFFHWGNAVVQKHGLEPPQPIMCSSPESGDCQYMFQSGSKYYLRNPIEGGIGEIVASVDLVDIITEIDKPRTGSLKLAKVYQMPSG
jgi:hypothetical protein